jgi:hypothetical protein
MPHPRPPRGRQYARPHGERCCSEERSWRRFCVQWISCRFRSRADIPGNGREINHRIGDGPSQRDPRIYVKTVLTAGQHVVA